jgi:hypothetical protein
MKRGILRWTEEAFREDAAKRTRWQKGSEIIDTGPQHAASTDYVAPAAESRPAPARRLPAASRHAGAAPYPLVGLCRSAGIPEPIPEYKFHPLRKWRGDYVWPIHKLLVEIDGGAWSGGRHTRGAGFIKDMEKLNAAALLGYSILRYTPQQLDQALIDIKMMLA